ncbi:unnamed protein product [Leuciscus chuanchicus]
MSVFDNAFALRTPLLCCQCDICRPSACSSAFTVAAFTESGSSVALSDVCGPLHPVCLEVHCSNVDVRESRDLLLNYHPAVLSAFKSSTTSGGGERQESRAKQYEAE